MLMPLLRLARRGGYARVVGVQRGALLRLLRQLPLPQRLLHQQLLLLRVSVHELMRRQLMRHIRAEALRRAAGESLDLRRGEPVRRERDTGGADVRQHPLLLLHRLDLLERLLLLNLVERLQLCLLYTSPSPRDVEESRMPSSA